MAEIAGLVIGGVALATLFDTTMDAFDYIEAGATYGSVYDRYVLRESLLKLRLSRWAVGVREAVRASGVEYIGTADMGKEAGRLLGEICSDLEATKAMAEHYKIKDTPARAEDSQARGAVMAGLIARTRKLALARQRDTSVAKKTRWALRDARRFKQLLENLDYAVTQLEDLFPAETFRVVIAERKRLAGSEFRELVQPSEDEEGTAGRSARLELLVEACTSTDPMLQETVKQAAQAARNGHSFRGMWFSDDVTVRAGDVVKGGARVTGLGSQYEDIYASGRSNVHLGNTYS